MTNSINPGERDIALFVEHKGQGSGVEILKKGRLIRISHPEIGHNYLLDVTDSPDETTGDETHAPELVRDLMKDVVEKQDRWGWNDNNGVICLIINAFSETPQERARVYIAVQKTNKGDPELKEITSHLFDKMGFLKRSGYVPFSFNGYEAAQKLIKEELIELQSDSRWADDEALRLLSEPTIQV